MPDDAVAPVAAAGFTSGVAAYERGRPTYPPAVIDLLVREADLRPGRRVLDLAAGTGKMTELLVATGAEVVAVEPVAAMRDVLAAKLPDVEVLDATAEATGLEEGSLDAVVVAQAFHWFRAAEALDEIARVLRPGGVLALAWNSRDARVPWVAELGRIIRWNAGAIPTYDRGDERWTTLVEDHGAFGPVSHRDVEHAQVLDEATLVDRVASTSYIAVMEPAERQEVLDQVRVLVEAFGVTFELPYVCDVYWCRRR